MRTSIEYSFLKANLTNSIMIFSFDGRPSQAQTAAARHLRREADVRVTIYQYFVAFAVS